MSSKRIVNDIGHALSYIDRSKWIRKSGNYNYEDTLCDHISYVLYTHHLSSRDNTGCTAHTVHFIYIRELSLSGVTFAFIGCSSQIQHLA